MLFPFLALLLNKIQQSPEQDYPERLSSVFVVGDERGVYFV